MPTVDLPTPVTLVVAGTFAQFRVWQSEDYDTRKSARYVSMAERIRGYRQGTTLVFVGTYYERRDLHEIAEYAGAAGYITTFEKST